MNIAGIIWDAVNIYDGIAIEIYVSGCYLKCPGCHNPKIQDFDYGSPLDIIKLIDILKKHEEWFDIISILGGDLMCQPDFIAKDFIKQIKEKFPNKKLWLFTGKDRKELSEWCFQYFDVIKVGRYMQNLHPGNKLASWNQNLLYKGIDF